MGEGQNSRIEFEYQDNNGDNRKAAFTGRWILEYFIGDDKWEYHVALTEKEQIFVLLDGKSYETFHNFQAMVDSAAYPENLLAAVADELGENYVEELDI